MYEVRLFFRLHFSKKIQEVGGNSQVKTVRTSECSFRCSQKHRRLAIHMISQVFLRAGALRGGKGQRDWSGEKIKREKWGESQFWFLEVIRV